MNPAPDPAAPPLDDDLRPHSFDGIQEYDKRMPNWWLMTFYGAIVFWIGYWFYHERAHLGLSDQARIEQQMSRIESAKLAAMAANQLDDASLWQMSRNPVLVAAGKSTFDSTCASCHLPSLRGKSESPTAVGPDLTDRIWIHGGRPLDVVHTVTEGVLTKGMPGWGPVLGQKKIAEAVAYILSHHEEGEPVTAADAAPPSS